MIPNSRIGCVAAHLPSIQKLADLTLYQNRKEYCKRYGYGLVIKTSGWQLPAAHPVSWDRLEFLRDLLVSGNWDALWCAGADVLITNLTIPIQSRMSPDTASVWAAPDWCAQIQADSFIVRADEKGIGWVNHILSLYEKYKGHPWVENQAMLDTLGPYVESGVVAIKPQYWMNAYPYRFYQKVYRTPLYAPPRLMHGEDYNGQRGDWKKGDWVLHIPSIPFDVRLAEFRRILPMIIR